MCEVKIYKGGQKLMEEVSEYKIDLRQKILRAYSLSRDEKKEFKDLKQVRWKELDDSLCIE